MNTHPLSAHLQRFFTERLADQMQASPHTVASYRDTFRLLLTYARERLGRAPTYLRIDDIDAELVGHFLELCRNHAREQRSQPQCATVRNSVVFQIRRRQRTATPASLSEGS